MTLSAARRSSTRWSASSGRRIRREPSAPGRARHRQDDPLGGRGRRCAGERAPRARGATLRRVGAARLRRRDRPARRRRHRGAGDAVGPAASRARGGDPAHRGGRRGARSRGDRGRVPERPTHAVRPRAARRRRRRRPVALPRLGVHARGIPRRAGPDRPHVGRDPALRHAPARGARRSLPARQAAGGDAAPGARTRATGARRAGDRPPQPRRGPTPPVRAARAPATSCAASWS